MVFVCLSAWGAFAARAWAAEPSEKPDFHCLHVPTEQWGDCVSRDMPGWRAYQWALKNQKTHRPPALPAPRGSPRPAPQAVPTPQPPSRPWTAPPLNAAMERLLAEQARIQQERNAAMAAQRQALIKRDEARRAQRREQEKSKIYYFLEPNRGLLTQAQPNFWTEPRRAGHPVEGAPAGAKVRIFGNTGDKTWLLIQVLRTGNESGYGDKYWVESPSVKVLGTETDILRAEFEEQERQAELARQQQARERQEALKRQQEEAARQAAERQAAARREQAEALAQRQRQQIADFQEARRALHRLFWWFVAASVLLACLPAYRLFAPHKLAEFGSWRVKGLFLLSCGGLTVFFRGMLMGESASVDSTYLAFWGGILGIPALFFLPGAILLFFQFLHYLVVPHPAESSLDRARTSQGVALDAAKAAAESMYDPKRDGVFEAWRAQNRKRRLAAEEDMLRMENAAMEALMKQQQMKARRSPPKETPP